MTTVTERDFPIALENGLVVSFCRENGDRVDEK